MSLCYAKTFLAIKNKSEETNQSFGVLELEGKNKIIENKKQNLEEREKLLKDNFVEQQKQQIEKDLKRRGAMMRV